MIAKFLWTFDGVMGAVCLGTFVLLVVVARVLERFEDHERAKKRERAKADRSR